MDEETINFENTGAVIDEPLEIDTPKYYEMTENDKELLSFVVEHTDRWREYRDQSYLDDWLKYERMFYGKWTQEDKQRGSERSRVISPATQQAVETRHAEIVESIFGQGEFFDIADDINDTKRLDVEKLKKQLYEDFKQDKLRKSIDQIALMAEIYGIGIGEITVSMVKEYKPMTVPIDNQQAAYGVGQAERVSVKLVPVNPKNFLFDPNGLEIDDCMGVAIEKYVSIHKIAKGIAEGKYNNVDISSMYEDDSLESTQEKRNFEDDKVKLMTYYGLVPREYLQKEDEEVVELFSEQIEDYTDMVEAIIVIGNDNLLLKAEESPYMMKDRPVVSYQADTVPNRLVGRGACEKAFNMQAAIDGSMRSHMDSMALTTVPMVAIDATRLPRGAKFEVKPGKAFLTNGAPNEIIYPFQFGTNDGQAMTTSKEFERMLLMATGTVDSAGSPSQVSRDNQMDMATATMIKKYKRTLVNFQEDFLIPFIYKAAWRFMQFDPERYPAEDVKFIPTATLGIIAREHEQKQMAFMIQTLGAQSPLTPVLMSGMLRNSSLADREAMIEQIAEQSKPDPKQAQMAEMAAAKEMQLKDAEIAKKNAEAQKTMVEAQLAPDETKAKVISALSNNLDDSAEGDDFERRARIADLMMKEEDLNIKKMDIESNERITMAQMMAKRKDESDYMSKAADLMQ
jgi:hypothetical protein